MDADFADSGPGTNPSFTKCQASEPHTFDNHDISGRPLKRRRTEEPWNTDYFLEHITDATRRWDIQSGVLMWSSKIEVLLGYDVKDIPVSIDWWRHSIHPDDRQRITDSLDAFFEMTSQYWNEEYRYRISSGGYITIVDRLQIIRDQDGKAVTVVGAMFNPLQRCQLDEALNSPRAQLMRDIRQGKISSDELRYQTQLIKTITDNTTSGLFMMDAKGRPTFMNPASEKITGYKLSEISSRPLHYAVHYKRPDGSYYPMEECPVDNSQAALVPMQNQEEIFVDKYGRLFPVIWSIAPLEKDNKTVGAVLEFRDVTHEKAAQAERLKTKLEAEQQLVRAQEAESHRRMLTEFIDYVCHEIRNPLHGIAASTEFLTSTFLHLQQAVDSKASDAFKKALSEGQQHLESIRQCVDHQTLITNNVLDLSRFEAGQVDLCNEVFEPCSLMRQTINIIRGRIIEKKIKLREVCLSGQPGDEKDIRKYLVKGDLTRLRQLLLNLVGNAIKFTPENGEIEVRLDKLTRQDSVVTLVGAVSDTGVGMTPDEQWHVFQRFYQSNKKISSEYGGSGLGLNICDQIVKLMNGSIQVTSEKNVGSTFKFTVQLSIPTESEIQAYLASRKYTAQETSHPPTPVQSPPPDSLSSSLKDKKDHVARQDSHAAITKRIKKVLVVEDNKINQKIVTKYLSKLGYVYAVANNGLEAVNMYIERLRSCHGSGEDGHFDFVLMDMEMPVMDGREATKRIREFEDSLSTSSSFQPSQSEFTPSSPLSPSPSSFPQNSSSQTPISTSTSSHTPPHSTHAKRTPIVALSGNARDEKIKEALDCGVDDYLIKPCNQQVLEKMIQKWEHEVNAS
ncbi:hypothetical protein BKA69DRAFT_1128528 [Paraphysoderma sedebokerense]|nr:hypothetical protein BKA69DRAFT_1128528 [Paraphysoderma sedebokerense]